MDVKKKKEPCMICKNNKVITREKVNTSTGDFILYNIPICESCKRMFRR